MGDRRFDDAALVAALGPRAPATFDRAGRIRLLAEVFRALMDNRLPSREAALFVAGGGLAWLSQGGSIERDFWKVAAPPGSHHTPAHVWREFSSSGGARD